ncbi:MAG: hypothetical protein A2Z18_11440 [Armatimonadetes bacterium RBG_16_58_9]|nr:MAG: hypothetical protein A2Z18_11440 [Armatimonadetes bacterium RBG_16_58_9]
MKLDKKQLPQLIVLGLLVVVCVGYVSFTVLKPKRLETQPKPPAQARQAADDDRAAQDDSADGAQWKTVLAGIFPDLTATPSKRDPFSPQPLVGAAVNQSILAGMNAARRNVVVRPKIDIPPMNPLINPYQPTTRQVDPRVVDVPRDTTPDFMLTGVVCGNRNVAIIRTAAGGRYVVRQGQLIDGRYKVLYVADDGAVLAYEGRRIHLKLGGAKNAS